METRKHLLRRDRKSRTQRASVRDARVHISNPTESGTAQKDRALRLTDGAKEPHTVIRETEGQIHNTSVLHRGECRSPASEDGHHVGEDTETHFPHNVERRLATHTHNLCAMRRKDVSGRRHVDIDAEIRHKASTWQVLVAQRELRDRGRHSDRGVRCEKREHSRDDRLARIEEPAAAIPMQRQPVQQQLQVRARLRH
jgi:hypothetical protein